MEKKSGVINKIKSVSSVSSVAEKVATEVTE